MEEKKRMLQFCRKKQNWTKRGLMFSERKICARKPGFWAIGEGLSNTEIKWKTSLVIKAKKASDNTFLILGTVNNI